VVRVHFFWRILTATVYLDLLTGKTIDRPPIQTSVTFKRAPKAATKGPERKRLNFD